MVSTHLGVCENELSNTCETLDPGHAEHSVSFFVVMSVVIIL